MTDVGDVVAGRYQVVRPLGDPARDAQGEAFEVKDLHTEEVVAIKLLKSTPLGTWHEAKVLTQLRDDHILPIRNADLASGQPYIVTQLATRGTLGGRLEATGRIGVEPAQAVRWIRQACQAVARTHAAGLVHTDVKPDNLFLDEHDNVQLGDYGFANLMNSEGLGYSAGTVWTMAPETGQAILDNQLGTSIRSDVYGLGATLYELLTGQPPYQPPTGMSMDLKRNAPLVATHQPRPVRDLAPHVPRTLADRLNKAIASGPQDRYPDAGAFAAALGSLPKLSRRWHRTDEHGEHHRCWRGVGRGAEILLCAVPAGRRYSLTAAKLPNERTIRDARASAVVTDATLPGAVRKIIKFLD